MSIETLLLLLFFVGLPLLERLNQWSRDRRQRPPEAPPQADQPQARVPEPMRRRAPPPPPPRLPDMPRQTARAPQPVPDARPSTRAEAPRKRAKARPRPQGSPPTMPVPDRAGADVARQPGRGPRLTEVAPAKAAGKPELPLTPPPMPPQARRRSTGRVTVPGLRSRRRLREAVVLMTVLGPCRAESPHD